MNIVPKTIRGQIMTAFLGCFVFMALIIAFNYSNFRRLSRSMQFFELAEELNNNLLGDAALREELLSLTARVSITKKMLPIRTTWRWTLQRERASLMEAIGQNNYRHFVDYLDKYADRMTRLRQSACDAGGCSQLQVEIRGIGQNLMILADQLVTTERRAINHLVQQMIPLPLISLLFLVILLAFVIFYIGERVIRPLARITRESEAVAKGAFQRITPYGDHKNEIHHLVAAINRMVERVGKTPGAIDSVPQDRLHRNPDRGNCPRNQQPGQQHVPDPRSPP